MKAVAIRIWKNGNGWQWFIDMDACELSAGLSFRAQAVAERHMRAKAAALGIDLDGVKIDLVEN